MIKSFSKIDEKWTHVAATIQDSQLKLYVDGKLEGALSLGGMIALNSKGMIEEVPFEIKSTPQNINIGAQKIIKLDEQKTKNYFSGMIDSVVVQNRALPIDQIYDSQKFST